MRPCEERLALSISQRHGVPELLGRVLAGRGVGADEAIVPQPSAAGLAAGPFASPRPRSCGGAPGGCRAGARAGRGCRRLRRRRGHLDGTSGPLLARLGTDGRIRNPRPDARRLRPERPHSGSACRRAAAAWSSPWIPGPPPSRLGHAAELGLEVIVVDHHAAEPKLPAALAVVNPNRVDQDSPLKHLAAVGVTFVLLVAVTRGAPPTRRLRWKDRAATAAVARPRGPGHDLRRGAAHGPQPRVRPPGAEDRTRQRHHGPDGTRCRRRADRRRQRPSAWLCPWAPDQRRGSDRPVRSRCAPAHHRRRAARLRRLPASCTS